MRHARSAITVAALWLLVMPMADGPAMRMLAASEPACQQSGGTNTNVLLCDDFDTGLPDRWIIGSRGGLWPLSQFVMCGTGFGFNDRCAAWSNHLLFD